MVIIPIKLRVKTKSNYYLNREDYTSFDTNLAFYLFGPYHQIKTKKAFPALSDW